MMKLKLTLIALLTATAMHAQGLPTAPVPTPLQGEHKIFLANASGPALGRYEKLMAQVFYAGVYNGLAAKGPYHPVLSPAEADLFFTISEPVSIDVNNGSSLNSAVLRIEITDAKTHALLWAIDEPIEGAFREKTFMKNAQTTIDTVLTDLATLSSGNLPSDANTAKYDKP